MIDAVSVALAVVEFLRKTTYVGGTPLMDCSVAKQIVLCSTGLPAQAHSPRKIRTLEFAIQEPMPPRLLGESDSLTLFQPPANRIVGHRCSADHHLLFELHRSHICENDVLVIGFNSLSEHCCNISNAC